MNHQDTKEINSSRKRLNHEDTKAQRDKENQTVVTRALLNKFDERYCALILFNLGGLVSLWLAKSLNHQDTKTQRKLIVVGLDHSNSLEEDAMFLVCF